MLKQLDQCIKMLGNTPKTTPNAGPIVPIGLFGDFDRDKPISVRPRDYSHIPIAWEKLVDRFDE